MSGSMRVKMRSSMRSEDGLSILAAGSTAVVSKEYGAYLVQSQSAIDVDSELSLASGVRDDDVAQVVRAGGLAGGGLRVVLLGDSLTAYNNVAVGISGISASGGVVTVVTSSAHNMRDGQRCNISGTGVPALHVRNVAITYISGTSFSYPLPGAVGSAATGVVLVQAQLSTIGDFVHANAMLGGRMRFVANLGVGGETTAQIRERVQEAFDLQPDIIYANGGTNDLPGDTDPSVTTMPNMEFIVSEAVKRGILVVLKTIPPFATGYAGFTAARNARLQNINQFYRRLATRYRGVIIVDAYRAIIDAANATGYGLASMYQSGDTVHWNSRAANAIGALAAAQLANVLPAVDNRVTSASDNYTTSTENRDLWDWAPWTNTGGTVNAPATGAVGTNWIIDAAGTWTVAPAVSMSARADGLGYDIVVTGQPGAAGATATIRQNSTAINARLTAMAGKRYRVACELKITNALAAALRTMDVYYAVNIGGVSHNIAALMGALNTAGTLALNGDAEQTLFLTSPEFVIPSGTVTSAGLICRAYMDASSASAITFKLGSFRLMPMDDML